MLHTNEIKNVRWFAENNDFKTYEFETYSRHMTLEENDADLFRFFFHHESGNMEVLVANEEDYFIHEDASNLFNLPELHEYLESLEVNEESEHFNEWYARVNEPEDF